MNTEDYVSYEQAVKLKEKGFDWECHQTYSYVVPDSGRLEWDEYEQRNFFIEDIVYYPRATLSQAQKWLREQHKISIRVNYSQSNEDWFADLLNLKTGDYDDTDYYATYEEALSAGITKALELI